MIGLKRLTQMKRLSARIVAVDSRGPRHFVGVICGIVGLGFVGAAVLDVACVRDARSADLYIHEPVSHARVHCA